MSTSRGCAGVASRCRCQTGTCYASLKVIGIAPVTSYSIVAFSGSDITFLSPGVAVRDDVTSGNRNCYVFQSWSNAADMKVSLTALSGDPDLYIGYFYGTMTRPCPGECRSTRYVITHSLIPVLLDSLSALPLSLSLCLSVCLSIYLSTSASTCPRTHSMTAEWVVCIVQAPTTTTSRR